MTIWIFVIATFAVVSFARVKKLKSVLEEFFEELDEAFEEVDYEQDTFVREIKELRERIKALEKTTNSDAIISSDFNLTEWIPYTKEEMEKDESKKLIGGYLKSYTYKEACRNWWNGMSSKNKAIICSMPNFGANVFKEITGIEVTHNVD